MAGKRKDRQRRRLIFFCFVNSSDHEGVIEFKAWNLKACRWFFLGLKVSFSFITPPPPTALLNVVMHSWVFVSLFTLFRVLLNITKVPLEAARHWNRSAVSEFKITSVAVFGTLGLYQILRVSNMKWSTCSPLWPWPSSVRF